jgi:hypothetical protein
MKKLFRYGAVASIFLLSAAPAALAQNYNSNYGQNPNYGQGWHQGGGWNQGGMQGQGWSQEGRRYQGPGSGWTQGSGGGWTQGSGGGSQQGAGGPTAQDAYQELSKYGYQNIQGMERVQGWEARATRNGERVHVIIDDDGMIATYRGP